MTPETRAGPVIRTNVSRREILPQPMIETQQPDSSAAHRRLYRLHIQHQHFEDISANHIHATIRQLSIYARRFPM
jgi:hypothetical protein